MKKMTIQQMIARLQKLKGDRGTWESHWQEVEDHVVPRKNTVLSKKSPGQKRTWQLLDNTGVNSAELLAGFLHGMLTNPDSPWFEMTTGDIIRDNDDEIRNWLQAQARKMHHVLNNSNFQTEVHEVYIDLTSIGTACQTMEEDPDSIVRFSTKFIAEYYIDEDHKGRVNMVMFEKKWKSKDLIEEFGEKGMHKDIMQDYLKKDGCQEWTVVSCAHKCDGKFYVCTFLYDQKHQLREDKFNEFPYIVPRWTKASGEKYGRSPGMTALPELKVLNKMNETLLIGAQKKVDPPVQMPDDGFILPFISKPGGINYYRSGTNERVEPVFADTNLDFGYQAMEDRRQRVRDAFYVDQLKLRQAGPMMTATEVLQRTEESMRLLGPMLGRMQDEFLRPVIDRLFNIMQRKGLLDPAPPALKGVKIDVRYSSLIAKSQRVAEAQNIMRTIEASAPFIQLDPAVADNFNGDAAVRIIAGVYGYPQLALNNASKIQATRKGRADAQAAQAAALAKQQEVQDAEKMASVAQKVGTGGF